MIVSTTGNDTEAVFSESPGKSTGILYNLLGIFLKLWGQCLLKSHSLSCNNMHKRTALNTRENSLIKLLAKFCILTKNQTATRTAQSFMSSSSYHICVRNWGWVKSGGHQTSNMSNIHHEISPYRMGNLRQTREIKNAGISRSAGHNQLWLTFIGNSLNIIIVQLFRAFTYTIRNDIKIFAGHVYRATMGKMAAISKVQTHYSVTGSQQGKEHRHIGLSSGVRLHIGILSTKEFFCAVNGQLFNHIHVFTATIITLSGIAFSIFVGKNTALGSHNGSADNIFRCNKLQLVTLAA